LFIANAPIVEKKELQNSIFLFKLYSTKIASVITPGQFINIRVSNDSYPLLRRPFSVCDVEGDHIYILFNIFGEGTKILAKKNIGETLDILGPLGVGFNLDENYDSAIIVAGGLGMAPFPFVSRLLTGKKEMLTYIGGRTEAEIIPYGLQNITIASDDGSVGFQGTVVDLLKTQLQLLQNKKIKVFGCGPTAMLKNLKEFCIVNNFNCEVSTECAMACGFGICQGCPIESTKVSDNYLLVCKDGPVFNVKEVVL